MTVHDRFLRLQGRLLRPEGGFRVVSYEVAYRFCRRFPGRIVRSTDEYFPDKPPKYRLILEFDHPEIGVGSQLIAFISSDKRVL